MVLVIIILTSNINNIVWLKRLNNEVNDYCLIAFNFWIIL